ncbi:MAG: 16S rRNA processing protein RimM [Roseiflexaceae bacterium]|nr:16S rRNA processing protein RimM [Roseiflexaceae bacterium]
MTNTAPQNEDFILVGEIVAAFGIKGQVKVKSYTDNLAHLQRKIKTLYVGAKRKPYVIKELFEHKPGLLVLQLEGVATRTAAEDLRGSELTILESQAAPLGEGEYFIHQLYRLNVLLESGEQLGKVREVLQTGANDVLVVAREGKPDALIPMINDVIVNLDLPHNQVVIRPLDGLFDE